jgi:DNA repair ATPase RecN
MPEGAMKLTRERIMQIEAEVQHLKLFHAPDALRIALLTADELLDGLRERDARIADLTVELLQAAHMVESINVAEAAWAEKVKAKVQRIADLEQRGREREDMEGFYKAELEHANDLLAEAKQEINALGAERIELMEECNTWRRSRGAPELR